MDDGYTDDEKRILPGHSEIVLCRVCLMTISRTIGRDTELVLPAGVPTQDSISYGLCNAHKGAP